jgi:hypothetical protein
MKVQALANSGAVVKKAARVIAVEALVLADLGAAGKAEPD